VFHKDRHGLKRYLSTCVLHHETLGFLVTWDVAGHADVQQLVLGGILELVPPFEEVTAVGRIIHLDVEGGSIPGILQLRWNGDTFLFDLFKNGLGKTTNSAEVNSLAFGFATSLLTLETIGSGKRGIESLISKTSTVFG